MLDTRRTPISCGAQVLFNLDAINKKALESLLQPEYKRWQDRVRPGGDGRPNDPYIRDYITEQRAKGVYDNKIYPGETVVFSDADRYGNGKKLLQYIKRHKLGEVVSLSTINPNTKNKITTYLWVYNGAKLKEGATIRGAK
jgi:hypothetical protein